MLTNPRKYGLKLELVGFRLKIIIETQNVYPSNLLKLFLQKKHEMSKGIADYLCLLMNELPW